MLNLRDRDLRNLKTLKRIIKKQLKQQNIKIEDEIPEASLKEIFSEIKERISQKTKYIVYGLNFPKDRLLALLFSKEL